MRTLSVKPASVLLLGWTISILGACMPGERSVESSRRGVTNQLDAFGGSFKGGEVLDPTVDQVVDQLDGVDGGLDQITSEKTYACELLDPSKDIARVIAGGPDIAIPISKYVRQDGVVAGTDEDKTFNFEVYKHNDQWVLDWPSQAGNYYLHSYEAKIADANTEQCTISAVEISAPQERTMKGCFDPATKILMADRTQRRIDQIKAGDLVFNPVTRQSVPVVRTTIGPEAGKGLFLIGVDGKKVKVTSKHPFMTVDGLRVAQDLSVNDRILTLDGSFRKIETIKQLPELSGQIVVNVALATGGFTPQEHMVLADGVVSGDLFLQERLERSTAISFNSKGIRSISSSKK